MRDKDTKILEGMYDKIHGKSPEPMVLVKEDFDAEEKLIFEGLVDALGGARDPVAIEITRLIMGLIKREIPNCQGNEECLARLDGQAKNILFKIEHANIDPMVSRTLAQYGDISPLAKVKILYKLLTGNEPA